MQSSSPLEPVEGGEPALEPERANINKPTSFHDVPTADNLSGLGHTTKRILHRQHQVEKDVAFLKDSVHEILDQFKGFRNLPTVLGQVQSLLSGRRKCSTNDFKVAVTCGS